MKKVIIFFITIIIIMVGVTSYICLKYRNLEIAKKENETFESYYGQEIFGADLATLINKTMDRNEKNNVEKDENNIYMEDEENSIKIDIKFTDDDKVHPMEELYNGNINTFVSLYNQIKFKCTDVKYHSKNNKIKYMIFEQIN